MKSVQSLRRVSKTTILVLLRLTVSWRSAQKLERASSCLSKPASVVDIRMRSSAYSNRGISVSISSGASMPGVLSKCFSRPSTNSPNSVGLNGHPCLTPIRHLNMADNPCDERTDSSGRTGFRGSIRRLSVPATPHICRLITASGSSRCSSSSSRLHRWTRHSSPANDVAPTGTGVAGVHGTESGP